MEGSITSRISLVDRNLVIKTLLQQLRVASLGGVVKRAGGDGADVLQQVARHQTLLPLHPESQSECYFIEEFIFQLFTSPSTSQHLRSPGRRSCHLTVSHYLLFRFIKIVFRIKTKVQKFVRWS